jgi:hypothetical protein
MVAIVMTLLPFWLETKVKYVLVVAIANFEPRLVYTNHIIMKKSTKKLKYIIKTQKIISTPSFCTKYRRLLQPNPTLEGLKII